MIYMLYFVLKEYTRRTKQCVSIRAWVPSVKLDLIIMKGRVYTFIFIHKETEHIINISSIACTRLFLQCVPNKKTNYAYYFPERTIIVTGHGDNNIILSACIKHIY